MRKQPIIRCLLCLLLLAGTTLASADVIRLKSGKTIEGTILLQNDEVVLIRDTTGTRYQYPISELKQGVTDSLTASGPLPLTQGESIERTTLEEQSETAETVNTGKKVTMGISVFGGGMAMPTMITGDNTSPELGGHAGADIMIGTAKLFGRRIFLGGSVGFQAFFSGKQPYYFIPLKFRAEAPLMNTKHAPMLGMGLGYGFGLQNVKGGFCADILFGWRYAYSQKGAFFMGVFTDFQGAQLTLTETVSDKEYTSTAYRNLCGFGAKMALYF